MSGNENSQPSVSKNTQSLRRKTLNWSQAEGGFYAIMAGSSETFAFYYAVKQGLDEFQLATLTMLPVLIGAFGNWMIPRLVKDSQLKRALLTLVTLQIIGLIGLFYSVQEQNHFPWILASMILYYLGGMSAGPIWIDWISGWLPTDRMGRYLSRRNSFVAAVTLLTFLLISFLVNRSESLRVFQFVFGIAILARVGSWGLLCFQKNPPLLRLEKHKSLSFHEMRSIAPLAIAILFTAAFRLASNIAAPFFLPYMLSNLHFSLLQYATITAVPYVGRALFLARWGETTRSLRPFIGLQIALVVISFVALAWSLTTTFWMLCAIEFASGVFWGGYELCTVLIFQNFAPRQARGLIGFHTAVSNLTALSGAYLGSFFIHTGANYLEIFEISFTFRGAIALFYILMSLRMPELRVSYKIYGEFLTSVLSLRPTLANVGRIIPARRRKEISNT